MYYAGKELKLAGRIVQSGEKIPEALSWDYPVLVAHLNLGWIKWVEPKKANEPQDEIPPPPPETDKDPVPAPLPKKNRKKRVNQKRTHQETVS